MIYFSPFVKFRFPTDRIRTRIANRTVSKTEIHISRNIFLATLFS